MRKFASLALLALALAFNAPARAQPLPFEGPIHIVSGAAAGSAADTAAHLIAEKMQAALKRPVVVDTRADEGGKVATDAVKNAPHDGSQLLFGSSAMMLLTPLTEKVAYDPINDFAPVGAAGEYQIVLATGAKTRATTYAALMTWLKNNQDKANYGAPASMGLARLYGNRFAKAIGVPMAMVPLRGGVAAAGDLTAGNVAVAFADATDFVEPQRAGRIRIMASSGTRRIPALPEVATLGELGLEGFDDNGWNAVFAPAGTPTDIIRRYNAAINEALTSADVALKLQNLGFVVSTSTPQDLAKQLLRERDKWRALLSEAGAVK